MVKLDDIIGDLIFVSFINIERLNGIGINDQELDKIFDLFYRVGDELTRTAKGTGLGLTLVKELLELMNGSICAVKHEKGAEFIITLPLCR